MRALFGNPTFRRLFLGRLVTNAGDSIYAIAASWLVYDLSGSSLYAGLALALTLGPQAVQVLLGPLVDRVPTRRVLVLSQSGQGLLVLVVPAAWALGQLTAELVLVVMPVVALLNQVVYPAQSAALPRIVEREDLTDANAAFSLAYQGTEVLFQAVAGLLVAAVGAVPLYVFDSLTFGVAVALFAGLRIPDPEDGPAGDQTYLADLREGLGFVRSTVLVWLFGASLLANALLGATMAVLPAFAETRGGPGTYGFLIAAVAGGSLVGALLAGRFDGVPYGRLAIGSFGFAAAAWFAALAVPPVWLTVTLFAVAFVPVGVTNVVAMAMVQGLVPEGLLGRVTATMGSASTAVMPVGAVLGGLAGDLYGPETVMVAGGLGFAWIVVYVVAVPGLRRLPAPSATDTLARDGATAD